MTPLHDPFFKVKESWFLLSIWFMGAPSQKLFQVVSIHKFVPCLEGWGLSVYLLLQCAPHQPIPNPCSILIQPL